MYAEPLARHGPRIRTCRVQRGAESVRVGVLSRVKVVGGGFHLVLKDAVGGSARCIADDEHAPDANIDPDGIRLADGSPGDRPARPVAGASLVLPAHGGHLQQSAATLPGRAADCRGDMAAAGTSQRQLGLYPDRSARRAGPVRRVRSAAVLRMPAAPGRPAGAPICRRLTVVSSASPRAFEGGGTASAAAVSYCLLVVRYRVLITGQVQGVNFRAACRRMALQHGVRGWVRNLPGGSVEAAFEGPADDVRQLLDWTRRGPQLAVVAGVAVQAEQPEGLDTFLIRY